MTETSLSSARASIIDSVFQNGLKSAKQLEQEGKSYLGSVGSHDKSTPSKISFASIPRYELIAANALSACLAGALYMLDESVFPVMIERKGEEFLKWDTQLNEEQFKLYSERVHASFLVVVPMNWSLDFKGTIPAAQFSDVIFPEAIWNEYRATKTESYSFNCHVTPDTKTKQLLHLQPHFAVPDYETILEKIIVEQNRDILIHGVRLPTEADLKKGIIA